MAHLGLALSKGDGGRLHGFIHEGIAGMDELAERIKEIIKVDRFAFLEYENLVHLLKELQPSAEAILPMELHYFTSQKSIRVLVDRGIFVNAILTLAQNAAKAGAKKFEVRLLDSAEGPRLELRDDGKGFPEGIVEDLFRHTVPSDNGGTGCGLLNVKFTLEFMEAKIRVLNYNHGGGGATRIVISGFKAEDTPKS